MFMRLPWDAHSFCRELTLIGAQCTEVGTGKEDEQSSSTETNRAATGKRPNMSDFRPVYTKQGYPHPPSFIFKILQVIF
jgi:hypothetical protein